MKAAALLLLCACAGIVNADVYMHGMRGSNNRLNEANAERNNGNRLFDSQNNNRGGYNVGDKSTNAATTGGSAPATIYDETTSTDIQYPMVYYEGSVVQVEWTNQHGCGGNALDDPTLQNCNIVLQYACDNTNQDAALALALRDGTTTNQITTTGQTATEGIHESVAYYAECSNRRRNRGLFLADQQLTNGNQQSARSTRQNPNGQDDNNRRGLECPEERDYYPYWLPTPFVDIAYLTDRLDFCSRQPTDPVGSRGYIADNSENSSNRYKCYSQTMNTNQLSSTTAESCNSNGGIWTTHTWNLPPPECIATQWARSNHLGNARATNGQMQNYNWTLPSFSTLSTLQFTLYDNMYYKCILRLRYNISTDDYDMWNINSTQNDGNSPVKGNQQVDVGADLQSIQMSINTNQFGRTFQDRSHTFFIRQRPTSIPATARVVNLNVRGKRGNIVQTYPAMEYDFQPNRLHVAASTDFIHLQWTGSNTHNNNPNANDAGDGQGGDAGEGTDGTDRTNFVQIADLTENFPVPLYKDTAGTSLLANTQCFKLDGTAIGTSTAGQLNLDCAVWLATSGYFRTAGSVTGATGGGDRLNPTLDNAPPSLIGGVVMKVTRPGMYFYIGSRNNNFSNRSQKGVLIVDPAPATP